MDHIYWKKRHEKFYAWWSLFRSCFMWQHFISFQNIFFVTAILIWQKYYLYNFCYNLHFMFNQSSSLWISGLTCRKMLSVWCNFPIILQTSGSVDHLNIVILVGQKCSQYGVTFFIIFPTWSLADRLYSCWLADWLFSVQYSLVMVIPHGDSADLSSEFNTCCDEFIIGNIQIYFHFHNFWAVRRCRGLFC